jgi:hypothetical protein
MNLSTVMDSKLIPEQTDNLIYPGFGKGLTYRVIRFYADGSTDLPPLNENGEDKWFLSFYRARQQSETKLSTKPKDYGTIQIFRKIGSVRVYRP